MENSGELSELSARIKDYNTSNIQHKQQQDFLQRIFYKHLVLYSPLLELYFRPVNQ